jgi:DoxX-like family
MAPLDFHSHLTWLRLGIASVWLLFGLFFKALGAVPRHRKIVARVVGEDRAGAVLWFVASAEIGLGAWMIVGRLLPLCLGIQTIMIVTMNALELRRARDLLLAPAAMVCANVVFLGLGWYVALAR